MARAYDSCYNLTGNPVCGNNVTNMAYTYHRCYNLTGSPVCGENVTSMVMAYHNCRNLAGNTYVYSDNISNIASCFNGRYNTSALNIYVNNGTTSLTTLLTSNSNSMVGLKITWADDTVTNGYYYNTYYNIYIYPVENVHNARIANGE